MTNTWKVSFAIHEWTNCVIWRNDACTFWTIQAIVSYVRLKNILVPSTLKTPEIFQVHIWDCLICPARTRIISWIISQLHFINISFKPSQVRHWAAFKTFFQAFTNLQHHQGTRVYSKSSYSLMVPEIDEGLE